MKTLIVKKRRKTPRDPWKKKKRKPRYLEIKDLVNYWNQEDQVLYCFKCNVETTDHEVDANPPNVEYKIWYAGNDVYEPRRDNLPPGTSTVARLDRTRRADGPREISATVTKQPYIFCMTCHGPLCLAKKWNGKYYPELNFKGWPKNEREPIPIPVFEMPTSLEDAAEKIRLNHYLMVTSDHEHAFRAGCFFKWVCKKLDYGKWGQWIEEN